MTLIATIPADAAARLYDAEVNLHQARQSGVDTWISAAYDLLHRAVQAHADACRVSAATGCYPVN
jgi:hypothetical protein